MLILKIMNINYKPEIFESTYFKIEELIKDINKEWFINEIIKITFDDKLLNLISLFNIDIQNKESNFIEIKIIDLIHLSFITKMLNIWLSKTKSKDYIDSFRNNENIKKYKLLIDFYILQLFLWSEVNLYIFDWIVWILSQEEFFIIKKKFWLSGSFISINFNNILYDITKKEWCLNIKNNLFVLEDKVIPIFEKLYDIEYKKLNIQKDKDWELFLLKSELEFSWDDIRYYELVDRFEYAEIISKINRNKTKSYIVREFTKFN